MNILCTPPEQRAQLLVIKMILLYYLIHMIEFEAFDILDF